MPVREIKKHEILENLEELNVGNSLPVSTLSPPGTPPADKLIGPGLPVRILNVNGPSQRARVMTIAMSSFVVESENPLIKTGGPIIGIIEFGNGGVFTTIEVDVPFGAAPLIGAKNPSLEDGLIISLPGSSFRVSARNDGNAFPIDYADNPINGSLLLGSPNTMQVKAWISYLPRSSTKSVRRLFSIAAITPPAALAATPSNVPAFSKAVRFLRFPLAAPINYTFFSGQATILDSGTIPAGVSSPLIEVPTQTNIASVDTGGVAVSQVWGDYYLEA